MEKQVVVGGPNERDDEVPAHDVIQVRDAHGASPQLHRTTNGYTSASTSVGTGRPQRRHTKMRGPEKSHFGLMAARHLHGPSYFTRITS